MLEAWQERLIAEKAELDKKLRDLEAFINGEVFEGLGDMEKSRLRSQRYFMNGYAETLNQRIEALYQAEQ